MVLKREYLDERALQQLPPKNQGSGSARVSMGLEESKKVFGSTGGFGVSDSMPPPYKPYVPSSYNSYDKANGHNVPGNDAVTRPVTAYPPYQPQPQPQSSSYTGNSSSGSYSGSGSNSNSSSGYPTSYNTYNQSSGSSASGGVLDGQGWYNQTASRAVNQAIGRVIRHKKDWGAIFLLDDRFQNDKQVQQLSSWVRPRLSKYQRFPQALVEFRRFLTSAMADPDLKIPVPVPAAVDSRPPGYVQAMAAIAASTAAAAAAALEGSGNNFIMRKISIRESDLDRNGDVAGGRGDGDGDSAGVSFIDPELLMTQQTEYSTRTTSR